MIIIVIVTQISQSYMFTKSESEPGHGHELARYHLQEDGVEDVDHLVHEITTTLSACRKRAENDS